MPTPFSALLARTVIDGVSATLDVPEDWLQGRSVFGGLQAVIAVQALRTIVDPRIPLRALQMAFIAPVPQGPVRAEARLLRSGKNVTHAEALLRGAGGDVLASVIGVFGAARDSQVRRSPERPLIPPGGPARTMRWLPGLTPNFTQHFQASWSRGGLPFTGDPTPQHVVQLDLHDDGPVTELTLIAIADFIPPVALALLTQVAPGSSLTWLLELVSHRFADWSTRGWRVDAELEAAADGYTSQATRIWAPDGQLAALSRQSMVVFG